MHIIDNLPVVVFEYTIFPNGARDFTYVSPRCEEILGVSKDVFLKGVSPLKSFIHPDDHGSFNETLIACKEQIKDLKWEGRILMSESEIKWVEVSGTPTDMGGGRIVWSGVISDIGKRKELEQIHREDERRYKDLLETLPIGIGVYQNGVLVYTNEFGAKIMGAEKTSDLIGRTIMEFVHPDYKKAVEERIKLLMMGLSVPLMEQKYIRLDGRVIVVETSAKPYDYQGKPAVQIIVKDVTEQKENLIAVRKSEILFSQLFEDSPMAIVMLDSEGKVSKVNRGFEQMFNYTIQELEGLGLNQFIVPEALESEGNDLNTLISAERVVRIESVRLRKDKTRLSVIIYGVPVHLEDKTIGIFGVYVDITEQKKVEEELKVRNAELDNFVYKVSHDLRAPLSSVLGLVNLANLQGNDDDLSEYLKIIGQKVGQLDHFISDVLSHSKNLKLEVKIEQIDLQSTIDKIFTDLDYLRGADEIEKKINIDGNAFFSDPWRIAEILRNLISNAIKYKDFAKADSQINLTIKIDQHQARIVFSDNGIGINKTSLIKIFDMFYRASEQSDGSGLGLYIVKNAVDKLNGQISVSSEVGRGTTFEILLPNHTLVESN